MIETKLFEVRDAGTFIPVVATLCIERGSSEANRYLLSRAGFGADRPCVMLATLEGGEAQHDPYDWRRRARTIPVAHKYITEHWHELTSGDVVDVEFITGVTSTCKVSERLS